MHRMNVYNFQDLTNIIKSSKFIVLFLNSLLFYTDVPIRKRILLE